MSPEQKEGIMIRLPQVLSWGACLGILGLALKLVVSATAKDIALATNGTEIVRVEAQSKARDDKHDADLAKLAETLHKIEQAQATQGAEIKSLSRLGERVDDKLDDILIRLPRQQ